MTEFLSDEAIARHKEYLYNERLKYSILEKSISGIKSKKIDEIMRQKMSKKDKSDVLSLLSMLTLHDIFFSSFRETRGSASERVKLQYGSEAAFLNFVYKAAMSLSHGFVSIVNFGGKISVRADSDALSHFYNCTPSLAVDVSEHVYFLDYGFEKDRYIINALSYLDLKRLDEV